MKWRAKWSHVVIALAVVAALAIAAPAIGGPSLKKLVKKEVSKQITKATGPQGPPGINGTNGTNGTAVAFAAVNNDGTLVSDTDIPGGNFNITQAQVSHENTGQYCFKVPGVRSAIASVSDGGGGIPNGTATVAIGSNGVGCPNDQGFTAHVQTSLAAGNDADLSFFVWFQ